MSSLLPSYLHTLRKQWGLSQPELAELLGISPSALCKVETLARRPSASLMLGAEVIFGHPAQEIFPGTYQAIEASILERIHELQTGLETRTDPISMQRLRLFAEIIAREQARD